MKICKQNFILKISCKCLRRKEWIYNNNRTIEITKSKDDDYFFWVNNKFICSNFYLTKDAENFIERNKKLIINKKHIVIYGLGFRYLYKRAVKKNIFRIWGIYFKNSKLKNKSVTIALVGLLLEKDLQIIKARRENINIFTVGRTLDILMKDETKSDVITILIS